MHAQRHQGERWVLVAAFFWPMAMTYAYFVLLHGHNQGSQQVAYLLGKTIQFALPAFWMMAMRREKLPIHWPTPGPPGGLAAATDGEREPIRWPAWSLFALALAFGATVGLGIYFLYVHWLGVGSMGPAIDAAVRGKLLGIGINSPAKFLALATFYCLVHAFLEEYYWRWFVYGLLRERVPPIASHGLAGIGFMLHHVIVLGHLLGYTNPLTYAASLGIASGGIVWSVFYEWSKSLLPSWWSHALVDVGIMAIGYRVMTAS